MKRKLFLAAIASVLLVNCSNDETASFMKKVDDLDIITAIPGVKNSKALKEGIAFNDGESIKLAAKGINGYSYKLSPYTYATALNKWNTAVEDKLILLDGELTACAVYPSTTLPEITDAGTGAFDSWKMELKAASSSLVAADQNDYMWATVKPMNGQPINKFNGKVLLDFYHALSRISFVLNKNEQYTGPGKVTKIVLKKNGGFDAGNGLLYAWNTADITESIVTWKDAKVTQISCEDVNGATLNEYANPHNTKQVAHMIIAPIGVDLANPNGLAKGLSIELTVDDKTMVGNLPNLVDAQGKSVFLSGKYYEYLIEVAPAGLIINPLVKVFNWVDTPAGDFEIK